MAPSDPDRVGSGTPPLERERERAIELLAQHFAVDNISLEDLEHRMEQVYRAASVVALQQIIRDLPLGGGATDPAAAPPVGPPARGGVELFPLERGRIVSIMAETKRTGFWALPRRLDVWAIMSDTRLDLTEARLSDGVTEIRVRGLMAALKVILPAGVRVVLQPGAFMSSVSDDVGEQPPVGSRAPVVRITGQVVMAELKVGVRGRGLA